jgi:hypothetical protein
MSDIARGKTCAANGSKQRPFGESRDGKPVFDSLNGAHLDTGKGNADLSANTLLIGF